MATVRFSTPADIPALRSLWQEVFGDSDADLDRFFDYNYTPEKALVLEEEGAVRSMYVWFDVGFTVPGHADVPAAYLYALATRPESRGKGYARQLIQDSWPMLRQLGKRLVVQVPAQPSLHIFYEDCGFHECFINAQYELNPVKPPFAVPGVTLEKVSPEEYIAVREALLADVPRITYPPEVMAFQDRYCADTSGGLYVGHTMVGSVCLCLQRTPDNLVMAKEYLGGRDARMLAASKLYDLAPNLRWIVRCPLDFAPAGAAVRKFGMLHWLEPEEDMLWDKESTAYLGLAFD